MQQYAANLTNSPWWHKWISESLRWNERTD